MSATELAAMPNEWQVREAIRVANTLPMVARVTRLYAIAMIFYRQPLGELALDALHEAIGADPCAALFFLCGFSSGAGGHFPSVLRWMELVPFPEVKE